MCVQLFPLLFYSGDNEKAIRKRIDIYHHVDKRLNEFEKQVTEDMLTIKNEQVLMLEEMHRLNEKLENRFDRYFIWGYGTLLVIITALINSIFSRQKQKMSKA